MIYLRNRILFETKIGLVIEAQLVRSVNDFFFQQAKSNIDEEDK